MIFETHLNDGTPVCIRGVRPDDEKRLREGIARLSPVSRYLRFFSGLTQPPQRVIDDLLDVDGHDHIAWGAIRTDINDQPAIGVVHAFREEDDHRTAQFSVAVIDEYHGRGLARLLTAVLLLDCKREGFENLLVHILPENRPAIALTRSLGGTRSEQTRDVAEFDIEIDGALASLAAESDVPGMAAIFAQFAASR
ncbi:GNAT family N-acetyltransferase [Allopontixanthobacter sp.]|uniref:GNAT family N-acetyltransferase n=1 Tax=Allopontixanthobacter sp. TaxID=2906452 RepID=UPI002AB9923B|nr:GNAT family N-acetyltransferase [Allopontixanthobacter sp.]MDZ4307011.1 GNAT family N-acetyltransferase [Allopontixanthobacter sp.]